MGSRKSGFSDLLAPGFYEIFSENVDFKQWPEEYSQVFQTATSKRAYEEESMITGFGSAIEKNEGDPITYDDPIQGRDKRYTFITHALGFRVSQELYEDDLYGKMKQMPKELAFSLRDVCEVIAAGVFNTGFTDSTDYQGPDGEPLFGDGTTKTHPLLGGGTGQNQLSVAADLSHDSLELMLSLLEEDTNERGMVIKQTGRVLIVHPRQRWTAKKIVESELQAFSAQNQMNVFKDMDLKYFVWHYLTDPDAFFVLAGTHYLKWFNRVNPQFENDDDFDTGDAKFKGRRRSKGGYTHWKGVAGSPGAD